MKFRLYLTTSLILLLLPLQSAYMQGYKIDATIQGIKDSSLLLSYRYGTKFYSLDTARVGENGRAVFEDTVRLERGMYQIVLSDKSYIDFFIDDEQSINIRTNITSLIDSLHSDNSFCNEEFFKWQTSNRKLRVRAQSIQERLESLSKDSQEYEEYQEEISVLRDENKELWDNAIKILGTSLPGKFLRGMRPFEIPENESLGPDGNIDHKAQYEYYKNHFFDPVDFSDPALIRTPLIHSKMDQFFTRVVPAIPDSVMTHAEKVVELSSANPEMFQFVVQFLLNQYSDPKIMGMDAVYVFIAENYYLNGRASWVSEENLKLIADRVQVLKPLLIGELAPELKGLETPEGERIDIRDINASYIVLYFWEPDCSFCKTATPNLKKVYDQFRDQGLEVVAVNTRIDKEPWNKFIAEHELDWINVFAPDDVRDVLSKYEAYSTPKLYILDKHKRIAAKDIGIEQLPQILKFLKEGK